MGQFLRAADGRGPPRQPNGRCALSPRCRLDAGCQLVPGAGQRRRHRPFRHLRLDAVPLPTGRSAGTLRVQGLAGRAGLGTGGVVYPPPELGARFDGDMDDLKEEFFLYGSQGATTLDLVPLLAFKMLGMQVDPVFGISGRGDGRLMFERGEANIDYQTSSAYLANVQPLVDGGTAVPIFSMGLVGRRRQHRARSDLPRHGLIQGGLRGDRRLRDGRRRLGRVEGVLYLGLRRTEDGLPSWHRQPRNGRRLHGRFRGDQGAGRLRWHFW